MNWRRYQGVQDTGKKKKEQNQVGPKSICEDLEKKKDK